jgi:hypothetical protein
VLLLMSTWGRWCFHLKTSVGSLVSDCPLVMDCPVSQPIIMPGVVPGRALVESAKLFKNEILTQGYLKWRVEPIFKFAQFK